MRLHIADWKWACIHSSCLLGVAAFVVFVIHPGGFEGQVVGHFFYSPVSSRLARFSARFQTGTERRPYRVLGAIHQFQLRLVLGNQLRHY
jgi:hypothetical protein